MSQLRTIARAIARADRLSPRKQFFQPAHRMRLRAFNVPTVHPVPLDPDGLPSDWAKDANREAHNAAKGIRRDRRAEPTPGPAEQPGRQPRARYYRFASRVRP
jgi:hypothetical protein